MSAYFRKFQTDMIVSNQMKIKSEFGIRLDSSMLQCIWWCDVQRPLLEMLKHNLISLFVIAHTFLHTGYGWLHHGIWHLNPSLYMETIQNKIVLVHILSLILSSVPFDVGRSELLLSLSHFLLLFCNIWMNSLHKSVVVSIKCFMHKGNIFWGAFQSFSIAKNIYLNVCLPTNGHTCDWNVKRITCCTCVISVNYSLRIYIINWLPASLTLKLLIHIHNNHDECTNTAHTHSGK